MRPYFEVLDVKMYLLGVVIQSTTLIPFRFLKDCHSRSDSGDSRTMDHLRHSLLFCEEKLIICSVDDSESAWLHQVLPIK